MLQHDKPDDFVIATGESHTVREFVELAFEEVGIKIEWEGKGIDEKGMDKKTGKVIIQLDPRYFRPTEVDILCGDSSKARRELGWKPKLTFKELIKLMVKNDLEINERELYLKNGGYRIKNYHE